MKAVSRQSTRGSTDVNRWTHTRGHENYKLVFPVMQGAGPGSEHCVWICLKWQINTCQPPVWAGQPSERSHAAQTTTSLPYSYTATVSTTSKLVWLIRPRLKRPETDKLHKQTWSWSGSKCSQPEKTQMESKHQHRQKHDTAIINEQRGSRRGAEHY